jgi:hypothetical protein
MKRVLALAFCVFFACLLMGQRGLCGLEYGMEKYDAGQLLKEQGYWYEGMDEGMEGFENTDTQPQYISVATASGGRDITGWMLYYDATFMNEDEAALICSDIMCSLERYHGINSYLNENGDLIWQLGFSRYVLLRKVDWDRSLEGWLVFYGDENYPDQFGIYSEPDPDFSQE